MTRKIISICYKVFTIFSLISGIFLNLSNTSSVRALMSYYTLQSNVICLIAFMIILILELLNKQYQTDIYYLIKGGLVITIAITAIIYHIALAPGGFQMDALQNSINNKQLANFLVHTVSPILVLLDYVLFDEKGHFKLFYPILWLIQPLNYVVYVYTYSNLGGSFYNIGGSRRFAYFFLDYKKLGYLEVLKWLIVIILGILIISELLVVLDKILKKD
mgnify:FL=1